MKTYQFNDPVWDDEGNIIGDVIVEMTEYNILVEYWDHWKDAMVRKYGEGHELITEQNCIDDFTVVNWAWEKKDVLS